MDESPRWRSYQLLVILFAAVLTKPDFTTGLHGVFVNGRPDSYLVYRFPKSQTVFITEISFTFSTKICEGVIVEMTSKDTDSFYQFSLNKNGALDFSFKSGGDGEVYIPPSTRNRFCNGEEHSFHFRREGYDVTIRVNNSLEIKRSFPNLYNPFSKPDLLIIGRTSRSETFPHFRGCVDQVKVVNYKTKGDPQPTRAEPIAIYLQRKSNLVDERNVHPCNYVPTTPRSAGQRMSKTDVINSTSKSPVLLGNPFLLSTIAICQATWICRVF